jgi:hypothetical protein
MAKHSGRCRNQPMSSSNQVSQPSQNTRSWQGQRGTLWP